MPFLYILLPFRIKFHGIGPVTFVPVNVERWSHNARSSLVLFPVVFKVHLGFTVSKPEKALSQREHKSPILRLR